MSRSARARNIEIEDRRLALRAAYASLFELCTQQLHMSEGQAFRRINAARLRRRFPLVLALVESGAIHLSALVILRDVHAWPGAGGPGYRTALHRAWFSRGRPHGSARTRRRR